MTFNLDINECIDENLNSCEQLCNNTHAAHNCLCFDGYRLNSDGFSCSGIEIISRNISMLDDLLLIQILMNVKKALVIALKHAQIRLVVTLARVIQAIILQVIDMNVTMLMSVLWVQMDVIRLALILLGTICAPVMLATT